jgi:hypothetical protein
LFSPIFPRRGDPPTFSKQKGPQDFRLRPFGSTGFAMDYKTGAQTNTSVYHRQFVHAFRLAYSIDDIKYYSLARVSTRL